MGVFRSVFMLAVISTAIGGSAAAQLFALPNPEQFALTEDQIRARLLGTPCTEADEGRGCFRYDGRLERELPCAFHNDDGEVEFLPTDQCYKMEPAQLYRGVWIDEFEDQQFVPEGTQTPEWPRTAVRSKGWREQFERARLKSIWINTSRVNFGAKWQRRRGRRIIEFVGRKTKFAGDHGHLGMSGHEIIVDRVISLKECPETGVCA
ncbi:hypothetical protein SAMN05428950_1044 [Sphingomonas sp. OV641]|nr:hypothetical protein SAMN05428950_1044 [Sphingomonas sp. OV641]